MIKQSKNENIGSFQTFSFILTIIFIAVIIFIMSVHVSNVTKITKKQSYEQLSSATEEVMNKIEENFRNDRVNLRLLSKVIAEEDNFDSLNVSTYLSIYDTNSLISSVSILTPENKVIKRRGSTINADGILDYKTEVLKGEHISGLQPSLTDTSSMVIRSYMPIRKNGKTIGLLFAEMIPENIGRAWSPMIYNDNVSFCIAERKTGEILVNTWDPYITNVSQLNYGSLSKNITDGKTGFKAITNNMTKQNIYISFMPMLIEDWEIFVTVSEDKVFESVQGIKVSLNKMIIVEAILLLVYFLLMLNNTKKSVEATEQSANLDALTGLPNRNRYEKYCKSLDGKTDDISCVYIDANGLHEINNTRGHLAGDQMLRFIADTLKVEFGENNVYRIGGDEFVVFQRKKLRIELELILRRVHSEIRRNDYHISSGLGIGGEGIALNEMIKTAEKNMYEEKRKYYESKGLQVRNKMEENDEE